MRRLTVLYDASCGFCVRCRWWLVAQPAFVDLEFLPARSPDSARRFPRLDQAKDELIVVDDQGGVYRGAHAWIMCLYALRDYRELSQRLAHPLLLPAARRAFALLSSGRRRLARWLELASRDEIAETLREAAEPPACGEIPEAACGVCSRPIGSRAIGCDRCRAPHHIECWKYLGGCATYGCGSRSGRRLVRAALS